MKSIKIALVLGLFLLILGLSNCKDHPYEQGQILYENFCANCHMADGSGLVGLIPPLAGADYWRDNQESLACLIRYGIQDTIVVNNKTYHNPMAGLPNLTEFEIANIINYINQAWGHQLGTVVAADIKNQLKMCQPEYYPK